MPWKTADGKYLVEGQTWTDSSGIKHPANWNIWTEDYKKNTMNLTWEAPLGSWDSDYYYGWNSNGDALLPIPVANIKTEKIRDAKQQSSDYLSPTDWYVTRKSERDVAIPSEITAFRTAVLANYTSLKTAINNASDIAGIQAIYANSNGASQSSKTINAHSSDVVSTSNNTITISGHGFVDDEAVIYETEGTDAIGGLVNGHTYFIIQKTTNNFKLSESHSNCGDATAISLTAVAPSNATAQKLTSMGIWGKGQTWPKSDALKYDGS